MPDEVRIRIQERVDALKAEEGASPRSISLASGMSADAIRDIFRKPDNSVTIETLRKLAVGLKTSPEWLAFGLTSEIAFGGRADPQSPPNGVDPTPAEAITPSVARLIQVPYGGVVEAGSFRAVADFDDLEYDEERLPMTEPADREYPDLPMFYYDVAGDSMNKLEPRPILPGDRVVGIPFAEFRGRLALRDGMVVVVEQTLDGGHHRERSVKQVELYDDRIEFHPRSTNKKHKPIVVPRTVFTDPSEGDGREVNVLAVCRRISNELPL